LVVKPLPYGTVPTQLLAKVGELFQIPQLSNASDSSQKGSLASRVLKLYN